MPEALKKKVDDILGYTAPECFREKFRDLVEDAFRAGEAAGRQKPTVLSEVADSIAQLGGGDGDAHRDEARAALAGLCNYLDAQLAGEE